jgi:hypothetical protein
MARRVTRRLPVEFNAPGQQPAEANPGVVVNINFCSAGSSNGEYGHEVSEDCCSPWWGLEGYDSA